MERSLRARHLVVSWSKNNAGAGGRLARPQSLWTGAEGWSITREPRFKPSPLTGKLDSLHRTHRGHRGQQAVYLIRRLEFSMDNK